MFLEQHRSRLKAYGGGAFSRAGPLLWNSLPVQLRTVDYLVF